MYKIFLGLIKSNRYLRVNHYLIKKKSIQRSFGRKTETYCSSCRGGSRTGRAIGVLGRDLSSLWSPCQSVRRTWRHTYRISAWPPHGCSRKSCRTTRCSRRSGSRRSGRSPVRSYYLLQTEEIHYDQQRFRKEIYDIIECLCVSVRK